jgi:O-antigen ligase
MDFSIDTKYDKKISFFVAFYFVASAANATMKIVLPIPGALSGAISALWGVTIVFFLLKALGPIWRRSSNILMASYFLFLFLYLFSVINCYSRNEPIVPILRATAFLTFAWWIPVGVAVCSVRDKSVLYRTYLKASYWISALMFINLVFHRSEVTNGSIEYDMFFGFTLITPTLIHINEFYNNKNKWVLLLSIIEVLALLLYGNRSILITVVFFVFFKTLIANQSKNIFTPFLLCLVLVMAYMYWDVIALKLVSLFDMLGMRSRSLELAINGSIVNTSGRDVIWNRCWQMIEEKPLFGWGIGGECYTIAQYLNSGRATEAFMAASAHNGIIQLLVELGVLFGSIAIIIMVWPMLSIKKVNNIYARDLILVFFSSYGVTRLISSDGFLYAPQVAIYLYLFYFRNHFAIIHNK